MIINLSESVNWAEAVMASSSVLTLLALILALIQIRHVNRQMHRELEMQYLLRFWQLMDQRSEEMRLGRGHNEKDKLLLLDYFQLSSDQIGLRRLGRVTDHTWSYWSQDIRNFCKDPKVNELLNRQEGQFKDLKKLVENRNFDPIEYRRPRRLWEGL